VLTSIVLVFIVLLVVLIGWLIGCLFLLFLLRRLSRCIVLGWSTCSYLAAVYSLFLFVCYNSKWRQSGGGCIGNVCGAVLEEQKGFLLWIVLTRFWGMVDCIWALLFWKW